MRAAMAQDTPPPATPADVDGFLGGLPTPDASGFFALNTETDQAVSALRYIFGDVINVVAGTSTNTSFGAADTAFANMIGMMNAGLIFLAAVYLAWVTIVGTLYTADKGEIFGNKWSVVWMPIKTTLGVSAIFPVVYGYSWLQIFIFWVLLNGIGLGNSVMQTGFSMFKDNREFSQIEPVPPDIVALSNNILRSAFCAQALNQQSGDTLMAIEQSKGEHQELELKERFQASWNLLISSLTGNPGATGRGKLPEMKLHTLPLENNMLELEAANTSGEIIQTMHYYWGIPADDSQRMLRQINEGSLNGTARADYCGHLKFSRVIGYHEAKPVDNVETPFGSRQVELKGEMAEKFIIQQRADWRRAAEFYGFGRGHGDVGRSEMNALDAWVWELHRIGTDLAKSHSLYTGAPRNAKINPGPTHQDITEIIYRVARVNKAYIDWRHRQYQRYRDEYVDAQDKRLEEHYWDSFTTSLRQQGWLSFGAYYVELSEVREQARKLITVHGLYTPSSPDIWQYFQTRGDEHMDIESMSDSMVTDLFRYFRAYNNFQRNLGNVTGIMSPEDIIPGIMDHEKVDQFIARDAGMTDVVTGGSPLQDMAKVPGAFDKLSDTLQGVITEYSGTDKLQAAHGPPPLLRIREMGEKFLSLVGPTLGWGGAISLGGNVKIFSSTMVNIISSGAEYVGGLLMTLALWLFLLGGFLAVYLPMVPFLVWVGAVIGYFLLAIESIIAAPLWAIAFMEPATQDGPGGKNAQGWYLVMNLFLRPVLLVVAMIAVMLLADVVLNYLNLYMLPTFEMATGAQGAFARFLVFVWTSIIYCVFMLVTMHGVYSLIHRIPDNIMEWLGVGVRHLGDLSDERDVRGMVMAAIYKTQAPSAKAMGNIAQRGSRPALKTDGAKISTRD